MKLFILGLGYSALVLARRQLALGWSVAGTVRGADKARALCAEGIQAVAFNARGGDIGAVASAMRDADALLVSIPPGPDGDALPHALAAAMTAAPRLRWIGYLSTIGVYGDHVGRWVDETTACSPVSARSRARLIAERAWTEVGERAGKPVIVFRLPGIYGPGRNALVSLRQGTARRIVKPGQVFNRIHVQDIAAALDLSVSKDTASAIYNVTDDEPSPPQHVVAEAAMLLGVEAPPEVPFADAGLSAMGASFYGESKRVRNGKIKRALGFSPAFPSYREGLRDLAARGEGAA